MSDMGVVMMTQKIMQTLSFVATIFRMAGGNEELLSVYIYSTCISALPHVVVYLFLFFAINLWEAVGRLLHSWFLLQCAVYHVHLLHRTPFTLMPLPLLHIQCVHIYAHFRVILFFFFLILRLFYLLLGRQNLVMILLSCSCFLCVLIGYHRQAAPCNLRGSLVVRRNLTFVS